MRFSVLSSILLICFHHLLAQKQSSDITQYRHRPKFESVKYQASIDIIGKHLSGILVFKLQEDSSIRTAFVNEMGITFFDVSFYNDSYKFNSIADNLDKKAVKISLAKDLGMILVRGIFKGTVDIDKQAVAQTTRAQLEKYTYRLKRKGLVHYHCKPNTTEIPLIENYGKKKKIITITQNYANENSMPERIFVEHHTVNFTILLKLLHATE